MGAEGSGMVRIAAVSALAGLLFGYDTGVISGALPLLSKTFGLTQLDYGLKEIIVSAVTAGALAGAAASWPLSRLLGRRSCILLSAALFILGTAATALAQDTTAVVAGRLVMGLAVGLSGMVVPMYLSEVSPPAIRGSVVFVFQLAITLGLLAAFVVNYALLSHENWRLMFGLGLVPATLLGLGMLTLPRSPRWLVERGREPEALEVLRGQLGREDAEAQLEEIRHSAARPRAGLGELFGPRLFPLLVVCFGMFAFQQLTGINTVFYYASTLFAAAGLGAGEGAVLASVGTGTVNVLATLLGIRLVDRWGRRKLLFTGFGGMVVCLAVLGAVLSDPPNVPVVVGGTQAWVALGAVVLFIVFFAVSLGGVPYVLMSELFPLRARAAGMALASCANWGFNFLVASTFLSLGHTLGMGTTFLLYAGCTAAGFAFAWRLVPETRGARLEDIEANLRAGRPLRQLGLPPETEPPPSPGGPLAPR